MDKIESVKYRRGTEHKITFPTLPSISISPNRVELIEKIYHHDILVLKFAQTSPRWFSLMKTGVPIQFSWKQGSNTRTWVGYVSFISKEVASQLESQMELHCIGSTFVLKERSTKVFLNKTISQVVRQLVTDHGFNFIGEDNGVVFDQLTLAGHSIWEWIVEQAKKIGYGVLVDNTNFYFRPLDTLIDQNMTSVPVVSHSKETIGTNNMFLDKTLDWFKVTNGEHVEVPHALRANKLVGGVDPLNGKLLKSTSSPKDVGQNIRENVSDVLFSEIRADHVVTTQSASLAIAAGAAQMARMNLPARLNCQGDPRIRALGPVLVQGTGDLSDGYWIAQEVRHLFSNLGDYQIEAKIATDGTGLDKRTATRQGTKDVVGVVNLKEALETSKTTGSSSAPSKLATKKNLIKEDDQGYARVPTKWATSKTTTNKGL